jgi:hypothetical protein
MMYFGQLLLSGEFQWTREFDDKLPILQIIFALPAALSSFKVWYTMSLIFIAVGAISSNYVVIEVLKQDKRITNEQRVRVGLIAALGTTYFFTFFPGGIHHINPASSALAITSTALLIRAGYASKTSGSRALLFVLSAFLASVSIGIRPYLFLPVLGAGAWALFRTPHSQKERIRTTIEMILWIACIGLCGLIANAIPYLFLGKTEAFVAGMSLLSQDLNPQDIGEIMNKVKALFLFHQTRLQSLLTFIAIFASLLSALKAQSYKKGAVNADGIGSRALYTDLFILSFALPVLLAFTILQKHYWIHYIQMFAPFFGIGLASFYLISSELNQRNSIQEKRFIFSVTMIIIICLSMPKLSSGIRSFSKTPKQTDQQKLILELTHFLENRPEEQRNFLYLDDMYLHWKLNEPRHGFPHASNTKHIIAFSWWRNLTMPEYFNYPTNRYQYCRAIEDRGPSIVIAGYSVRSLTESCLKSSAVYDPIEEPFSHQKVRVFERK